MVLRFHTTCKLIRSFSSQSDIDLLRNLTLKQLLKKQKFECQCGCEDSTDILNSFIGCDPANFKCIIDRNVFAPSLLCVILHRLFGVSGTLEYDGNGILINDVNIDYLLEYLCTYHRQLVLTWSFQDEERNQKITLLDAVYDGYANDATRANWVRMINLCGEVSYENLFY